jgi:hypothetical protein
MIERVSVVELGSARLGGMRDNEFTKILGWPGYRVHRHEIDEAGQEPAFMGAAEAGEPETDLFGMRAKV